MSPQTFNEWRIFPRLIAFFMAYMWTEFNEYFFSIPMHEQSEWALVQYGIITATFVGFAKFYMEGDKRSNNGEMNNRGDRNDRNGA